VKQRLGYVLALLGLDRMAAEVLKGLSERLASVTLQTHAGSKPLSPGWRSITSALIAKGDDATNSAGCPGTPDSRAVARVQHYMRSEDARVPYMCHPFTFFAAVRPEALAGDHH
jgi:hypothetical protein